MEILINLMVKGREKVLCSKLYKVNCVRSCHYADGKFWWKILGEHVLWKYVVENFGWRVFGGRFNVENVGNIWWNFFLKIFGGKCL